MPRKPPIRPALLAILLVALAAPATAQEWNNTAVTARPLPAPPPARLGLVAVGDIMMGTAWPEGLLPQDDGRDLFGGVGDALRDRDIVFGNLEGTLLDNGVAEKCRWSPDPKLCYAFRTPTRYVRHLAAAGFNAVNIANNHALDFGNEGLDNTLIALSGAGIQPVGGNNVARFTVGGRRVAILGFSYSRPGRHSASILNISAATARIRDHVSEGELVLVSVHAGAEGKGALHLTGGMEEFAKERRGDVEAFARAAIDAGAAAVIGHGPHVPRAIEIYKGKLIAYSLGNFLGYGRFNLTGPSGIGYALRADIDLESGRFVSGRIKPFVLRPLGIPARDPEGQSIALIRRLTAEDLGSRGAFVGEDGTVLPRAPSADPPSK
jgi:poly-gamma-glutamate capsule biosynthesis protein CapA/YwtB (metallophosphatase superfamily)